MYRDQYNYNRYNRTIIWHLIMLIALAGSAIPTLSQAACPCPTAGQLAPGPKFIVCNLQSNSADTNQLVVHASACFQGPVQFCSSVEGLPIPPLECLYFVGEAGQVPPEGFSNLEMMRTRAFDCSGTAINILFNTTTKDPADAFTLLKTIRACDLLRFTQIGPNNPCPVIRAVETQAITGVTGGCDDVLTLSVFDASGLLDIYSATGDCVSLLNFGQPSTASGASGTSGPLCLCWILGLCIPSAPCNPGETAPIVLSPACDNIFVNGTALLGTGVGLFPQLFLSNITKDNIDASDKLASIQPADLIRLTTQTANCNANYLNLRVLNKNPIIGQNANGIALCVSIEQTEGEVTEGSCVCLEYFGPLATLQDCWNTAECTGLDTGQIPPIPSGCNSLRQPGTVLLDTLNYTSVQVAAFSPTSAALLDQSNTFDTLRVGDCIKLYDPVLSGDFGLYEVTAMVPDNSFTVLGLTFVTGSTAPLSIAEITCLKTYGPCCQ